MDGPGVYSFHALKEKHRRKASPGDLVRDVALVVLDADGREFFSQNGGEPYCPECGCLQARALATRPVWKCSACKHQFSVTSGTIFADRKRPIRDYLLAIAIFANGAKGYRALQLSRDLNCQYKTASVLAHKLREVIEAEQRKARFILLLAAAPCRDRAAPSRERAPSSRLRFRDVVA